MTVNQHAVLGNVGSIKEPKAFDSGSTLFAFSVATTSKSKEGKEQTDWHNVQYWVKSEKFIKFLKDTLVKGAKVYCSGAHHERKYEKEGEVRYFNYINARHIEVIGAKGAPSKEEGPPAQTSQSSLADSIPEGIPDDIPDF